MSEQQSQLGHAVSVGGTAASHRSPQEQPALVGPATAGEFNTIKTGLIPIACWRLEDVRFEFDSSVVRPESKAELKNLADLVQRHPSASKLATSQPPDLGSPLSVFGHADPTGNDDYNKQLSGRRAKAIYALLTRRTELWEQLFSQPLGDDKWGRSALAMMLEFVALPDGEPAVGAGAPSQKNTQPVAANPEVVTQHEREVDRRKSLFLSYMDRLCGPELKLEKRDFLGKGEDPGGKADFQGCSEFNPVLILSQKDQTTFGPGNEALRNAANAPNRRVMVLIFRKGSRVNPSKWPCPRVNEGVAACRARFWSDGERRRTTRQPDGPRKFEETKDTFACRFYQRMTESSPCERATPLAPFRYALQMSEELPWTAGVSIRLTSEDRTHIIDLPPSGAIVTDTAHTFVFANFRLGTRYRAELIENELKLGLFGLVDISAIQDPAKAVNHVPLSSPRELNPPEGRGGAEIPIPLPSDEPTKNVPASELTQDL